MLHNKKSINELGTYLEKTHLVVDLLFLEELLCNAAKCKEPYKNKEFAIKMGCPINKTKNSALTIYHWIKGNRTIPFTKIRKALELSDYNWQELEINVISIKAGIRNGEIYPQFPLHIGKEAGSILGYILGDGSIEKRFNAIFFTNTNKDLLIDFRNSMFTLFRVEPRIWVQQSGMFKQKSKWLYKCNSLDQIPSDHSIGLFYPKICSLILFSIFGKFAEGKRKLITPEIKNSNKNIQKYLIRAFFDSEGSTYNYRNMIRVFQDDKQLLEDIRILLLNFDIKTNEIHNYIKRDKKRHYFDITNKENFTKFHELIGFKSKKKRLFPV